MVRRLRTYEQAQSWLGRLSAATRVRGRRPRSSRPTRPVRYPAFIRNSSIPELPERFGSRFPHVRSCVAKKFFEERNGLGCIHLSQRVRGETSGIADRVAF